MKKIFLFIILFTVFIAAIVGAVIIYKQAKFNAELKERFTDSEINFIKDIRRLKNKQVDIRTVHLFENGANSKLSVIDVEGDLDKNKKIVYISIENAKRPYFANPIEVFTAFQVWFYVKEQQHLNTDDIIGVYVVVSKKQFIGGGGLTGSLLLSEMEFEELLQTLPDDLQSKEDKVTYLTKLWIEKHNYKRIMGEW